MHYKCELHYVGQGYLSSLKTNLFLTCVKYNFAVRRIPVTTARHVLGLKMEERPQAMECSCEYTE
jgi:hypothetical protein